MPTSDLTLEKGLPCDLDSERFVLGSVLLDGDLFIQAASGLTVEDFSIEKHRRIFSRISDLHKRGDKIDRITVANELREHNQLESCDGLSYLVSLDDGLPRTSNIEGYIRIVRKKSRLRQAIFASQKTIDRCLIAEEDAADIVADATEDLLKIDASGPADNTGLSTLGEVVEATEGGINTFLDPTKRQKGLQTGFVKFDEMTGGLRPGELIVLAARPAMGKTALAMNIAHQIACAKEPKPVAVFSLEMSKASLFTRMLCAAARVDSQKFRAGYCDRNERMRLQFAAQQVAAAPLYIDDDVSVTLMQMHNKLRRLKVEQGLGLVIVDYLQLMASKGKHDSRQQEVSSLSRGLKVMSRELEVPLLVLSQLSRAPETRQGDHRPQLSDLRESGSIEQDADIVAFIFREEVYKPEREDLRAHAELLLSKQRNGPTGKINMVFLRQFTKFENRAADISDDAPPLAGMEDE